MSFASTHPSPIPSFYRFLFNYVEPCLAIGGLLQLSLFPHKYLEYATPRLAAYIGSNTLGPDDVLRTLYTHAWCGWTIIIFNDLITLRAFAGDVKVWRYVLAAHLCSDVAYSLAIMQDWRSRIFNVSDWSPIDWITTVTTLIPLLAKIAFCMGVGIRSDAAKMPGVKSKTK